VVRGSAFGAVVSGFGVTLGSVRPGSVRGVVLVSVFGAVVLGAGLVSVFGAVFGVVLVSGLVSVLGVALGSVRGVAFGSVLVVVPASGCVGVDRGVPLGAPAAGVLASDLIPGGGVCFDAARGRAATSVFGCPPLALEKDALLARAAATCAVW
jgi:hypothetical protein